MARAKTNVSHGPNGNPADALCVVELRGFEPLTSCMPSRNPWHNTHHKTPCRRPSPQHSGVGFVVARVGSSGWVAALLLPAVDRPGEAVSGAADVPRGPVADAGRLRGPRSWISGTGAPAPPSGTSSQAGAPRNPRCQRAGWGRRRHRGRRAPATTASTVHPHRVLPLPGLGVTVSATHQPGARFGVGAPAQV
jgi:hypothetical protein